MKLFYTGALERGQSQQFASKSLGGIISTTVISQDTLNSIFPSLSYKDFTDKTRSIVCIGVLREKDDNIFEIAHRSEACRLEYAIEYPNTQISEYTKQQTYSATEVLTSEHLPLLEFTSIPNTLAEEDLKYAMLNIDLNNIIENHFFLWIVRKINNFDYITGIEEDQEFLTNELYIQSRSE